jgi:hypothetical protein
MVKNAAHGGYREGSGRKPDPLKNMHLGAISALKILRELNHEKELIKLYKECGDARLKVHIIFRLREWGFGKPVQMVDDTHGFDPNRPLRAIVEHIGRPSDQAAAKAKRSGGPVE